MRTPIIALLAALSLTIATSALAEEPSTDAAATPSSAAALTRTAKGLQNVHGGLTAQSGQGAGQGRSVDVTASAPAAAKQVRPAPTPRALRKMNADHAISAIEPSIHACASDSASPAPTSFGLRVAVGPSGEVESSEATAAVPQALLACVSKAVASAKFGAPGPQGATIVVPITVPAHTAVPAAMADAAKNPRDAQPQNAVAAK